MFERLFQNPFVLARQRNGPLAEERHRYLSHCAQQQMSQAEAEYQDQPKGGLACAACTLFRPPRSCQVVAGDISPNGWCKFFDLPD